MLIKQTIATLFPPSQVVLWAIDTFAVPGSRLGLFLTRWTAGGVHPFNLAVICKEMSDQFGADVFPRVMLELSSELGMPETEPRYSAYPSEGGQLPTTKGLTVPDIRRYKMQRKLADAAARITMEGSDMYDPEWGVSTILRCVNVHQSSEYGWRKNVDDEAIKFFRGVIQAPWEQTDLYALADYCLQATGESLVPFPSRRVDTRAWMMGGRERPSQAVQEWMFCEADFRTRAKIVQYWTKGIPFNRAKRQLARTLETLTIDEVEKGIINPRMAAFIR